MVSYAAMPDSFEVRLDALDLSLFDAIESQSSAWDRRSLLACQTAIRERLGSYVYLEIGSHLGGSLQTHVMDPRCARIYSIDPRPRWQPDARGVDFPYPDNSTGSMMEALGRVSAEGAARVVTYDAGTTAIDPTGLVPTPHVCLIDGEHTDAALMRDFAFCRAAMPGGGLILCHDTPVVYNGLSAIIETLDADGTPYDAALLPDTILAIDLGPTGVLAAPQLTAVRAASFRGALFSLRVNDHYRQYANRWPWGAVRRWRARRGSRP